MKVTFDLTAYVSYWTIDGQPVADSVGYIESAYNQRPNTEYHHREVFYTKRFIGNGVWALLDTIMAFRQTPECKAEIYAAAIARGIDLDNHGVYSWQVLEERIRS